MSDDPRSKEVELFGETYDLSLDAGNFRIAQMRGEGIDPNDLGSMTDFGLGCRLAYVAVLPQLPDDKTEEDVVMALSEQGMADEAANHCLAQYLEMQKELGKSLETSLNGKLNEFLSSAE